jgi:hypothetical protein
MEEGMSENTKDADLPDFTFVEGGTKLEIVGPGQWYAVQARVGHFGNVDLQVSFPMKEKHPKFSGVVIRDWQSVAIQMNDADEMDSLAAFFRAAANRSRLIRERVSGKA